MQKTRSRFSFYAAATLAYTVLVIAWGAFVRATGSGAGCGEHWPLCNGTVLQRSPRLETIIELSHRLTSGLSLVLVLGLVVWAYRRFPKGHAARHGATLAGVFVLLEAALGAGLVLLKLVAHDASAMRAVSISLHLFNTFLLLSCLTYVAWYALVGKAERFKVRAGASRRVVVSAALVLFLATGIAGAVVALGDTLFPAASLADGFAQDLSPTAHFLIRLRMVHPALAVTMAGYVIGLATWLRAKDPRPVMQRLGRVLTGLVVLQVALGTLNLLLLAPIWLQLLHLCVADAMWIALVVTALEALPVADAALAGRPAHSRILANDFSVTSTAD